jgi:multiple antibiotic resistance protein
MTLGRSIFKSEEMESGSHSIVPLAFPIIAGAGTMTTLVSLKSQFEEENIIISIFINLIFIYLVLKSSNWIEKKLGNIGTQILRKVFGVILIAIAIKIFKTRLF